MHVSYTFHACLVKHACHIHAKCISVVLVMPLTFSFSFSKDVNLLLVLVLIRLVLGLFCFSKDVDLLLVLVLKVKWYTKSTFSLTKTTLKCMYSIRQHACSPYGNMHATRMDICSACRISQ